MLFLCRSVLFFSMLLSLGIGSQIGIMEGMIGTLFDIPQLKHIKKPILTGNFGYRPLTTSRVFFANIFATQFLLLNFCPIIFCCSFFRRMFAVKKFPLIFNHWVAYEMVHSWSFATTPRGFYGLQYSHKLDDIIQYWKLKH